MATVNASYRATVTANELAARIVDPGSTSSFDAAVFSFFSDVKPSLQLAFIEEMGLERAQVESVARQFSEKSGFPLILAALN